MLALATALWTAGLHLEQDCCLLLLPAACLLLFPFLRVHSGLLQPLLYCLHVPRISSTW
jgi:hypothetical protein